VVLISLRAETMGVASLAAPPAGQGLGDGGPVLVRLEEEDSLILLISSEVLIFQILSR
jgi:hypothetical protein